MPVITVQVGQCGNQVGQEFWQLANRQCSSYHAGADDATEQTFFRRTRDGRRLARCVLVDAEPKVVDGLLSSSFYFSSDRAFKGHSGCGNNWACGYTYAHSPAQQAATRVSILDDPPPLAIEEIMDGIRREVEAVDAAPQFLVMHSLAGGTGAGAGSALLQALRQEYPLNTLATASVVPRLEGDTPLQFVNASLALSAVHDAADIAMLFDNRDLLAQLQKAQAREAALGSGANSPAGSIGSCAGAFSPPPFSPAGISRRSAFGGIGSPATPASAGAARGASARGVLSPPSGGARSPAGRSAGKTVASVAGSVGSSPADRRAAAAAAEGTTGTVGFPLINRAIARHLAGALWPLNDVEAAAAGEGRLQDLLTAVCCDPVQKFVEARTSTPRPNTYPQYLWTETVRGLSSQFVPTDVLACDKPVVSAATMVVSRGFEACVPSAEDKASFTKRFLCQRQLPFGGDAGDGLSFRETAVPFAATASGSTLGVHPRRKADAELPVLSAITCRSTSYSLLQLCADRTREMAAAGAYMHWFARYGVQADDIAVAADKLANFADRGRAAMSL